MWEVGDLIEFNGIVYQIGSIDANRGATRVVYRLDRKFLPSVEMVVRKKF